MALLENSDVANSLNLNDLEDGEIDDDEYENTEFAASKTQPLYVEESLAKEKDLSDSNKPPPPALIGIPKPAVEDDYASHIEHAIANALKKKGIEPPMPKLVERKAKDEDSKSLRGNSHRRKRKRQRDNNERRKGEKKRHREKSFEALVTHCPASPTYEQNDYDLDEYEMLNVRGGSPPPEIVQARVFSTQPERINGEYIDYSSDETCSSSASNSSIQNTNEIKNEKAKHSKKRRDRDRARGRKHEKRNNREADNRTRNRRDSSEESHRQEPRKLELCKFYLMECCAKKDKCSYMHSDFPCKYYYLGMDCVSGEDCKFAHGKPLTEQLRSILLKHLETAPKEILGDFKRICRATAMAQMASRHKQLCEKFGVKITVPNNTNNSNINRHSNMLNKNIHGICNNSVQEHQTSKKSTHGIPSLLDIVVKLPGEASGNVTDAKQPIESSEQESCLEDQNQNKLSNRTELKNLTTILKEEHFKKLSELGVSNLEQINKLTFGQLNEIGLTIADISEIQLKAIEASKTTAELNTNSSRTIQKGPTCKPVKVMSTSATSKSNNSEHGVLLVDYSQYLKDSNIYSVGPTDLIDDEKDEAQLVIDVSNPTPEAEDDCDDSAFEALTDTTDTTGAATVLNTVVSKNNLFDDVSNERSNEPVGNVKDGEIQRSCKQKHAQNFSYSLNSQVTTKMESLSNLHEESLITTTRSGSVTPPNYSHSPSPELLDSNKSLYKRSTIYDCDWKCGGKSDEEPHVIASLRWDGNNDNFDLNLPFQPVTNCVPATEIDASYFSHVPIIYKLYLIDLPKPDFKTLRKSLKSEQTNDPRLRRVLGLPDSCETQKTVAEQKKKETASSEDDGGFSPVSQLYSGSNQKSSTEMKSNSRSIKNSNAIPRLDPRRAANINCNREFHSQTTVNNSNSNISVTNLFAEAAHKQNIEIRNLLQNSEWYKNLSSNYKIMVNQQLALVSAELKKFHQDTSSDKIFDINFVLKNSTLLQILTNLGIYIDDNGVVAYVEKDKDFSNNLNSGQTLLSPNTNFTASALQMQSQQHLNLHNNQEQLQLNYMSRSGMPNISNIIQNMYVPPNSGIHFPSQQNMQRQRGPMLPHPNSRPSLLGMPPTVGLPIRNQFNPFVGNAGAMMVDSINFGGGIASVGINQGILPSSFGNFVNNGGTGKQHLQERKYGNNQQKRQQSRGTYQHMRRKNNYGNKSGCSVSNTDVIDKNVVVSATNGGKTKIELNENACAETQETEESWDDPEDFENSQSNVIEKETIVADTAEDPAAQKISSANRFS